MVSAGFYDSGKSERWLEAPELASVDRVNLFAGLRYAPSPDTALPALVRLIEKHPPVAERANCGEKQMGLFRLLGASQAVGDFLYRHPQTIDPLFDIDTVRGETEEALRLSLTDAGPGVDPDETGLIFARGQRGRNAAHAAGAPGQGLGLFTCAQLMERMGGHIEADLPDEGGLTITLSLPLA